MQTETMQMETVIEVCYFDFVPLLVIRNRGPMTGKELYNDVSTLYKGGLFELCQDNERIIHSTVLSGSRTVFLYNLQGIQTVRPLSHTDTDTDKRRKKMRVCVPASTGVKRPREDTGGSVLKRQKYECK